ncbi:glycosyltransferase family 4 protein [Levilactobacillus suantsaii]|uniref:Glycosyltransferase family 4 protein n=1 Tax=Levilactobacillus suantsaii TaxID=2292255 RepID=A0A4Q0VGD8_9LACO|nr:glycosyltransferase family 4 protein [Levilactobacillus suantsaii]QMU07322.1 glycosyltransferase family 4 protein [Levilactobacillus suantsaii]RXI77023.1 glycosyltransferase family 4 protein [Levilactobacillus suantsaii]
MNIGIFTDTYFPQVSGVATSIKTLRDQLEKQGHQVYIFTTTDPHVERNVYERNVFRFSSIPFVSFTDRRIAVRGLFQAYQIAKELNLDIVHTQTEFSMGWIGKFVARNLEIPCLHTYHTMYEDYLHYVANGKILKPVHVKQGTLAFCYHLTGVVAPSDRVLTTLSDYGVKAPIRVIPTGVNLHQYEQPDTANLRRQLGLAPDTPVILSLSRLAYEKNIKASIAAMPAILAQVPRAQLLIVGDGPARADLEQQVKTAGLTDHVTFTGEIDNDQVFRYYHLANVFLSSSDSESQGLTYIEAMAAGTKIVVMTSPYTDELLSSPTLGVTFTTAAEMIKHVVWYLQPEHQQPDPDLLAQKLAEISADTFGQRIINFYRDAQVSYEQAHEDSPDFSD